MSNVIGTKSITCGLFNHKTNQYVPLAGQQQIARHYNHENTPVGISIPVPTNPDVVLSVIPTEDQFAWYCQEQQTHLSALQTAAPKTQNDPNLYKKLKTDGALPQIQKTNLPSVLEQLNRCFAEKVYTSLLTPEQIEEVSRKLEVSV